MANDQNGQRPIGTYNATTVVNTNYAPEPITSVAASTPAKPVGELVGDLSPERYVMLFVQHGEQSTLPLSDWEKPFNGCGAIEEAARRGYLRIGGDVRCSIELTLSGRFIAEAADALTTLTAERDALARISRQNAVDAAELVIDLADAREALTASQAEVASLRAALDIAVSRGCDHCAESIRLARAAIEARRVK